MLNRFTLLKSINWVFHFFLNRCESEAKDDQVSNQPNINQGTHLLLFQGHCLLSVLFFLPIRSVESISSRHPIHHTWLLPVDHCGRMWGTAEMGILTRDNVSLFTLLLFIYDKHNICQISHEDLLSVYCSSLVLIVSVIFDIEFPQTKRLDNNF